MEQLTEPTALTLPRIVDARGNLSFIEGETNCPFEIERVYWTYDVPGGEERYGRALMTTSELVVALAGSVDVVVTTPDGSEQAFTLNRSYRSLFLPPMTWRRIENITTGAVIMTLASKIYDEADYIEDFARYKEITADGTV